MITACGGKAATTAPPPSPSPTPSPAPAASTADASDACGASKIRPMLASNLALYRAWGDAIDLDTSHLVAASGSLERVVARLPTIEVVGDDVRMLGQLGTTRSIADRVCRLNAPELVLAIDRDARWPTVVQLVRDLERAGIAGVRFAFAVDVSAVRLADNPHRGQSMAHFRELGADMTTRCPPIGDLFMTANRDELLARFEVELSTRLAECKCAVTTVEV